MMNRALILGLLIFSLAALPGVQAAAGTEEDLQVEITKKGLGKEVSIKKGAKEWFMLIEVTPDNTVVIRQEKENETFLVDESETHDRAMSTGEVDAAIEDFITAVKSQVKGKR
jgi:hypothetical protein